MQARDICLDFVVFPDVILEEAPTFRNIYDKQCPGETSMKSEFRFRSPRCAVLFFACFAASANLWACGDSEQLLGDDSLFSDVTDVRIDPESVKVGEEAQVTFKIDPRTIRIVDPNTEEVSYNTADVNVVVKLPEGLDYVTDSSQVDFSFFGGFAQRNPNSVQVCPDNSRAIAYFFDGDEFSTGVTNQVRLRIRPYQIIGTATVGAFADDLIEDPCNSNIAPEAEETLAVFADT